MNNRVTNNLQQDPDEKISLNAFQIIFVVYGLIYGSFWLKFDQVFHMEMNIPLFIVTSVVLFVLVPVTLAYNHKNETLPANKRVCELIALFCLWMLLH